MSKLKVYRFNNNKPEYLTSSDERNKIFNFLIENNKEELPLNMKGISFVSDELSNSDVFVVARTFLDAISVYENFSAFATDKEIYGTTILGVPYREYSLGYILMESLGKMCQSNDISQDMISNMILSIISSKMDMPCEEYSFVEYHVKKALGLDIRNAKDKFEFECIINTLSDHLDLCSNNSCDMFIDELDDSTESS